MAQKKSTRRALPTKPGRLIALALICLLFLSLSLTWLLSGWQRQARQPGLEKNYNQFVADLQAQKIRQVEMYNDLLYVQTEGERYLVRNVSEDYTIRLLLAKKVPLVGIPQAPVNPSFLSRAAYILALLLPYFILGAIVLAMVGAVSHAAQPELPTESEKKEAENLV